jgi:hypothetical protein
LNFNIADKKNHFQIHSIDLTHKKGSHSCECDPSLIP